MCLGSWPTLFKAAGRWRFELFYIDFAVAALIVAVLAAVTVGTLGSEMAFTDRMLVAGRSAQVFAVGAGVVFNLGNMLLLAAISLLGIAGAVPLGVGLALILACVLNFRAGNVFVLVAGIVALLITVVLAAAACRLRDIVVAAAAPKRAAKPGTKTSAAPGKAKTKKNAKGIIAAVLSGIPLGLFYPLAHRAMAGDFGLGPYAGVLLFAVGVLASTIVFNFYFLNIAIDGGALTFGAYFRGNARQHLLGMSAGALWAIGALCAALGAVVPDATGLSPALRVALPFFAGLLAVVWGLAAWKEFRGAAANARASIALTTVFFAAGLALAAIGIAG